MFQKFLEEKRALYKSIQRCYCPAIGQDVYFTSEGFHHLLYKHRRPRARKEQYYRLHLIDYLQDAVQAATRCETSFRGYGEKRKAYYVLEETVVIFGEYRTLKVILFEKSNGSIIFLSVMWY